jgi:L-rhamnose mutarotase
MERICFTLRVRPELLDEYRARHREVWMPMLREIALSGRRNYSLFLADDGLLVGYYETDSDATAAGYLRGSEVASRWEAEMERFFAGAGGRADLAAVHLSEVFNLEDAIDNTTITKA